MTAPVSAPVTAPAMPAEVRAVWQGFPGDARPGLARLRALVFAVADETGAGPVGEALRWNQPAYLAPKGTTLRLGIPKSARFALFVNCRTTLIEEFRPLAPAGTRFEGRRAVLFDSPGGIDAPALSILIARALTWHRRNAGNS